MSVHDKIVRYKCEKCDKTFPRGQGLKLHTLKYHPKNDLRPFKCPNCPKSFVLKREITTHIKQVHVIGEYKCDICEKVFTNKHYLYKHKFTHRPMETCPHCHKEYQRLSSHIERKHSSTTSDRKVHKCNECDMKYSSRQVLKRHVQVTHLTAKGSFKCDLCDKIFVKEYLRAHHIKNIHIERPYQHCKECDFRTKYSQTLKQHVQKNHGSSNVKLHECDICQTKFSDIGSLNTHIKELHQSQKTEHCDVCDKDFKSKARLSSHIYKVHEKRCSDRVDVSCDKCFKTFKSKCTLNFHIKRIH